MSTIKVNSIEPANAGSEDYFLARAWVTVNQVGTQAILGSENVSSITDSGTGVTDVSLSNAMANANYSIPTYVYVTGGVGAQHYNAVANSSPPTTSTFRLASINNSWNAADGARIGACVMGDLA